MNFSIQNAVEADMPAVQKLIQGLADYEKAPNEVITTADSLLEFGFGANKVFDVLVVKNKEAVVIGFALFYFKYSTWKGRALYLEDFFVLEEYRRFGIGQDLFKEVVKFADDNNCGRMEWQVLEWNEPAINFYKKMGAKLDEEWYNGILFPADFKRLLA